ncbi:MAG: lipase family protein [Alphaproteobacteria bacterium]
MRLFAALSLLLAVLAAPSAFAASSLQGDGGVSEFYAWTGKVKGKPGRLLRQEPLPEKLVLENAASGTRILYTSTDGLGGKDRVVVSGDLFLPKGDPPKGGWPLLAWAHGTVGVADVCAPSWAGRSPRDKTYLAFWLARGYAVVASDYQGLGVAGGHPYLATRPAAYSMLDAVRAVQKGGFPVSRRVVLIGQSQGGGAAFATAAYAPAYAPELDIRGTVATGTPYFSPEAQTVLQAARPRDAVDPTLGYNLLIHSLLEQIDPGFRLEDYVADAALPLARKAGTGCFGDLARGVLQEGWTFNRTYRIDPAERMLPAYALMGYPTLTIPTPIFMGTGANDRDVPPGMQLSLAADACRAGGTIQSHIYPGLDHSGAVNGSTKESSAFVEAVFAGRPVAGNCKALPTPPPA